MARRGEIHLGDEAKDTITGLTGCVVAITTWLNGCERISIQPRELKDGRPVDNSVFDSEQVELIKAVRHEPLRKTGGDRPNVSRAADPTRQ
jgi:hypothetical protein